MGETVFTPVVKRWCTLGVALVTLSISACSPSADATSARVVRVVDGDTLVVNMDGAETTVRLLNIDTPETKDPDEAVQCLGPEATNYLTEALPAGTEVGLDFDVEREDQYGRTLAAVFLQDQTLINAEIARQGLGSAVLFEPNEKYYAAVQSAQAEAQEAGRGIFGTESGCTLPSEVTAAMESLAEALEQPAATTSSAAAASAAAIAAALATAEALQESIDAGEKSVRWAAIGASQTKSMISKLSKTVATATAELEKTESEVVRLRAAEEKAAQEAAEAAQREAERKAAEAEARRRADEATAKAEAERQAAEAAAAAEAERIRNLPAPAPYVPPAPAPAPYVPPAPAPAPPAEQNPYPGYNGPRCYAPGGKTWKPCG